MTDSAELASDQLRRMRGMNRYYHQRFFSDVRFTTATFVVLFVVALWDVPLAALLIPPIALIGAAQTAFDASYLVFSRHYATRLEQYLNREVGENVLVAHAMEDRYLFPLGTRKIVTAPLDNSFSWFGFMTLFYTALGIAAFAFGLALGWSPLHDAGGGWAVAYLGGLAVIGLAALGVGWWWFVAGAGERRLQAVLDDQFAMVL